MNGRGGRGREREVAKWQPGDEEEWRVYGGGHNRKKKWYSGLFFGGRGTEGESRNKSGNKIMGCGKKGRQKGGAVATVMYALSTGAPIAKAVLEPVQGLKVWYHMARVAREADNFGNVVLISSNRAS